ncbi:MAG TPA: thioredoxin domain-containing protein [Acidimicrobiales bacterium]|nr:thioredoxin domain-containing protein [Acidimicrobiales bacterium]
MPNRLAQQSSPYLRQHADNPVDWYPWGDDAFAEARRRDVPVLLSVGYSSCHWCHVMAHESFEDHDVARVINELFVSVKVDREERPDVDAIYMEATQAMTGGGGWPMTVFLTPDGRPFFAGTYFPKESKFGRAGFVDVMRAVQDAWVNRRAEVDQQAAQLAEAVAVRTTVVASPDASMADDAPLRAGYELLRQSFDAEWGGFGRAPKFPQVSFLEVIARAAARNGSPDSLRILTTTLDAMASGGMYDHLGGGFHRYSVDAFWMVPHFEKMLYDQAQLIRAYLHGWQLTGERRYAQVVEETIGYVLRDLRSPAGGAWSAEDADSEGEEGRFYVWRPEEIAAVLDGDGLTAEASEWYGVTKAGNFEGSNILHRPVRGDLVRPDRVERARSLLLEARGRRVRPGLDDKVVTEWNARFVSSLAEAGAALGRADWVATAEEIAAFLVENLRVDGRWRRSWLDAPSAVLGYAVDHAWLVDGFTRLAEASGHARWIEEARSAATQMLELFGDPDGGGLFTTGADAERLIVRQKEAYDGATPSANGVAAVALLRLAALTGDEDLRRAGEGIVAWLAGAMREHPIAFTYALAALDLVVSGATEVAIVGERPDLVAEVWRRYLPSTVVAWGEPYESPLWEARTPGFAYVCRDFACRAPVSEPSELAAQLDTR